MIGYGAVYCIETGDRLQRYKRTKISKKRLPILPMNTAVIAYDSHGNWIVGTLFWEPLARGTSGGKEEAIKAVYKLQRRVDRIEYDYNRYITRTGFVVTLNADVYKIG